MQLTSWAARVHELSFVWVVVKIMVLFWVLNRIRHLVF